MASVSSRVLLLAFSSFLFGATSSQGAQATKLHKRHFCGRMPYPTGFVNGNCVVSIKSVKVNLTTARNLKT